MDILFKLRHQVIVPDIVVVFRKVYQQDIPIIGTMLTVIPAQVSYQTLPGKVYTFSFNACAIIVNKVLPHRWGQHFITQSMLCHPVMYLFACNPAYFPSFMQGELRRGLKDRVTCQVFLLQARQFKQKVHFKPLYLRFPITALFGS